jgi:argininosuccinate synthase
VKSYSRVVVAYSGGLDTSVMLRWIKERYKCEVIAACVDVGQAENYPKLKARALATGASKAYVIDARKEYVTDFIWPTLKAQAFTKGVTFWARPSLGPSSPKKWRKLRGKKKPTRCPTDRRGKATIKSDLN